ncbi:MAG TPA: hypothetical protein VID73_01340 [Ktedonobacterales bacterium]
MRRTTPGATTTRRRPALLAALLLAAPLALASCGATTRTTATHRARPPATPTLARPTATPYAALPLFGDWRIAYLTDNDVLRAYALDGTSDLAGPRLGNVTDAPTLSPDGRTLAYIATGTGRLVVLRLAPRAVEGAVVSEALSTFDVKDANWSPDGSRLAINGKLNGALAIYLLDVPSGAVAQVPGTLWDGVNPATGGGTIFGWADATHLVTMNARGTQLLDTTTGAATILALPVGHFVVRLSPDGRRALLSTSGCGAVPDLMVFDLASGAARDLPNIAAATAGTPPLLWQPGTSLALGMTAPTPTQPAVLARFDLDADTFTPLPAPAGLFPEALLPDGQTLLLARFDPATEHYDYYLEHPVVADAQPTALPATVARFVGFVRTGDAPGQGNAAPAIAAAPLFVGGRAVAHGTRWLGAAFSC